MWKEPDVSDLDAPSDMIKYIRHALFVNREGHLDGAPKATILQHVAAVVLSGSLLAVVISMMVQFVSSPMASVTGFILLLFFPTMGLILLYRWGWRDYSEQWYHFEDSERILTVIRKHQGQWEMVEVPYESVNEIRWSGGPNGYATIHAASMQFYTNREGDNRYSSVTEMWSQLAKFDTKMTNWPIILVCPSCNREFGHHIGTAQCPFDEVILVDPSTKGRIDPEELHPDDIDRV